MKLAIIDLGTHSVRCDLYDLASKKRVRNLLRKKMMIRLGDGLYVRRLLGRKTLQKAIRAFEFFSGMIRTFQADKVYAYATSALRDAKNSGRLISTVKKKTGINVKVMSGKKEAKLIAKAILAREKIPHGKRALVDVGGGSTEISIVKGKKILKSQSFDIGANRVHQLFLKGNPPVKTVKRKDPVWALRQWMRKELSSFLKGDLCLNVSSVVGSSGTIKTIAKILNGQRRSLRTFHKKELEALLEQIGSMSLEELRKIRGMSKKRADILFAGALILDEILCMLNTNRVYVTNYALRDGIFMSEIEKMNGGGGI